MNLSRLTLLTCLFLLVQIQFVDNLRVQAKTLALFGNLPHRSLGGLYWAHIMQPQREDYAYDYFLEWFLADKRRIFAEGQTRPVVPMYAVKIAVENPKDDDLQKVKAAIMGEQLKRFSLLLKKENLSEPNLVERP